VCVCACVCVGGGWGGGATWCVVRCQRLPPLRPRTAKHSHPSPSNLAPPRTPNQYPHSPSHPFTPGPAPSAPSHRKDRAYAHVRPGRKSRASLKGPRPSPMRFPSSISPAFALSSFSFCCFFHSSHGSRSTWRGWVGGRGKREGGGKGRGEPRGGIRGLSGKSTRLIPNSCPPSPPPTHRHGGDARRVPLRRVV
jgi:hypothetical protein